MDDEKINEQEAEFLMWFYDKDAKSHWKFTDSQKNLERLAKDIDDLRKKEKMLK